MAVVTRLRPGVTIEQAGEEMVALARSLKEAQGGSRQSIIVRSLREEVVGDIRHNLTILLGWVGILLLMACGNLANRAIVVAQFCLATLLLVGAGLLARSFVAVGSMDHPLEATWWNGVALLDQPPPREGEGPIGFNRPVGEGYFEVYQIPLREGRGFDLRDRMGAPGVMVVNESFVAGYFPDGHPLGQRVRFNVGQATLDPGAPTEFEVVGVLGDVRFIGFRSLPEPAFYIPLRQFPYSAVKVHIRTPGDPEALVDVLRAEIWRLDPELPITEVRTMERIVTEGVAQDRFNTILLGAFAVAQRRRELGIRLALGAEPFAFLGW